MTDAEIDRLFEFQDGWFAAVAPELKEHIRQLRAERDHYKESNNTQGRIRMEYAEKMDRLRLAVEKIQPKFDDLLVAVVGYLEPTVPSPLNALAEVIEEALKLSRE